MAGIFTWMLPAKLVYKVNIVQSSMLHAFDLATWTGRPERSSAAAYKREDNVGRRRQACGLVIVAVDGGRPLPHLWHLPSDQCMALI